MNGSNYLLKLENVTKRYGEHEVLNEVSLTIQRGEFVVIRGRNGSGKSTLLKIISGLIPFTSGKRLILNHKLVIGYTPDRLTPIPMTSTEYLTYLGKISKLESADLQKQIKELHELFQLEQSKKLKMTAFSKGMLQKLNLMQAMLKTPDLLVLDEPFSGLDKQSVQHLLSSLKKIKGEGTAILAAVHDPLLASQFDGRTYWVRNGQLETMDAQEHSNASYTLTLIHNELATEQLVEQFPNVACTVGANGIVTMTVDVRDYRNFLLECLQRDLELISLVRKEAE